MGRKIGSTKKSKKKKKKSRDVWSLWCRPLWMSCHRSVSHAPKFGLHSWVDDIICPRPPTLRYHIQYNAAFCTLCFSHHKLQGCCFFFLMTSSSRFLDSIYKWTEGKTRPRRLKSNSAHPVVLTLDWTVSRITLSSLSSLILTSAVPIPDGACPSN